MSLNIDTYNLGAWQTNCYVVSVRGHNRCWIVDAGYEPDEMIDAVRRSHREPSRLILTHAHLDHIAGIEQIQRVWRDLPVAVHEAEAGFLDDPDLNMSTMVGQPIRGLTANETLTHGQTLNLNGVSFEIRHTPGHSPGGITLYCSQYKTAIVGDTLFSGSIGRYDFATSDGATLFGSIRDQLLTLPDDTRILPGHGPETTIAEEQRHNPYL
jgi:hydroxyacylglutathione hydrolase